MRSGTLNARTLPTARSNSLIFCTAKAKYLKKKEDSDTQKNTAGQHRQTSLPLSYFILCQQKSATITDCGHKQNQTAILHIPAHIKIIARHKQP